MQPHRVISLLFFLSLFTTGYSQAERDLILDPEPGNTCNCISFELTQEKAYLVSAWVQEERSDQVHTYEYAKIEISFFDIDGALLTSFSFSPSGAIIEGWQQIAGSFTVPKDYYDVDIILKSTHGAIDVYFDDFRIQPYESSMKSYVYDPVTLKLMAELDENNYASFYEYDAEGGLIRVKKETEKGVYTIQESRSHTAIHP